MRLPIVNDHPVMPGLPPFLAFTQGKVFHVKPYSGDDTKTGRTPGGAWKTLAKALSEATANQNDVVLLYAESNTAANTTDYQAATLDWNKDGVHLIGINAGVNVSPRSRVAFTSAYNTASNLFTLSADGCYIANIEFYAGVAGTNPTGCMNVTGERNRIENCHIAGIGHDNNDIANAYSLRVAGSENLFKSCTIGLDTISHQFLKRASSASDRFTVFRNCMFINAIQSTGVSMLEALDVTAGGSPAGLIALKDCMLIGAAEWEASAGVSGVCYINSGAADAANGGVGLAITGA
jgi:hypothetical protein